MGLQDKLRRLFDKPYIVDNLRQILWRKSPSN
jgi:hypothetical protein